MVMEDIQSLNERAFKSELEVTAISAHAFAYVCDNYWIMRTGASMGDGYGPIIVSKKYSNMDELKRQNDWNSRQMDNRKFTAQNIFSKYGQY